MSRLPRSRAELVAYVRKEIHGGGDPWLSVTEVATMTQFHRRTLQRYVDEGVIPHDRRGPKQRIFVRWTVVKEAFPQDTRDI